MKLYLLKEKNASCETLSYKQVLQAIIDEIDEDDAAVDVKITRAPSVIGDGKRDLAI